MQDKELLTPEMAGEPTPQDAPNEEQEAVGEQDTQAKQDEMMKQPA